MTLAMHPPAKWVGATCCTRYVPARRCARAGNIPSPPLFSPCSFPPRGEWGKRGAKGGQGVRASPTTLNPPTGRRERNTPPAGESSRLGLLVKPGRPDRANWGGSKNPGG